MQIKTSCPLSWPLRKKERERERQRERKRKEGGRKEGKSEVWWHMPEIPVLGRLRQRTEFKASLGYIVSLCLKKTKRKQSLLSIMEQIEPLYIIQRNTE
jgi:hypothetical protein